MIAISHPPIVLITDFYTISSNPNPNPNLTLTLTLTLPLTLILILTGLLQIDMALQHICDFYFKSNRATWISDFTDRINQGLQDHVFPDIEDDEEGKSEIFNFGNVGSMSLLWQST